MSFLLSTVYPQALGSTHSGNTPAHRRRLSLDHGPLPRAACRLSHSSCSVTPAWTGMATPFWKWAFENENALTHSSLSPRQKKFRYAVRMTQSDDALLLRCSLCLRIRPRGWFQRSGRAKRLSWCRDCVRGKQSVHQARRRGAGVGRLPREWVNVLFERQGGRCLICRRALGPVRSQWHIDHVVPIVRGGQHVLSNLAVTHPACNLAKGAKLRAFRSIP